MGGVGGGAFVNLLYIFVLLSSTGVWRVLFWVVLVCPTHLVGGKFLARPHYGSMNPTQDYFNFSEAKEEVIKVMYGITDLNTGN